MYRNAGVDIDAGNLFAQMIREKVRKAWPGTEQEIGKFAGEGTIPPGAKKFGASTDGTGTKIVLAALLERFDGIGQDAVAMGAVDAYVAGSKPAYVLDSLDIGRLKPDLHIRVIESIIEGCKKAGAQLIGGETAELPWMFRYPWMINLNVFVLGFPHPDLAFVPVKPGQEVWGWMSGGIGSNGFSLLRDVFRLQEDGPAKIRKRLERFRPEVGQTLAEELLKPTPIYIQGMERLRKQGVVFAGHAHITGGGMIDNIPRILPSDCKVVIQRNKWPRPSIFRIAAELGGISGEEMDRTFNQGVMVVSIVESREKVVIGWQPNLFHIGEVQPRQPDEPQVQFEGQHNDSPYQNDLWAKW